jgi:hypothetical protein
LPGRLAGPGDLPGAILEGGLRAGHVALQLAIALGLAQRIGGPVEGVLGGLAILIRSGPCRGIQGVRRFGHCACCLRLGCRTR